MASAPSPLPASLGLYQMGMTMALTGSQGLSETRGSRGPVCTLTSSYAEGLVFLCLLPKFSARSCPTPRAPATPSCQAQSPRLETGGRATISGLTGTEGLLDRLGAFRAKPNDIQSARARQVCTMLDFGALMVIISFSCGSFTQDIFHLEIGT